MLKLDHKNFFELLALPNSKEKEDQLIELIDTELAQHFWANDRVWFNKLCDAGLLNVVKHCERTIQGFSLFNHKQDSNHFSNVSFIWAINSGNLELIQYFLDSPDFSLFNNRKDLNKDIGTFIQYYKERNKTYNVRDYEKLINFMAERFPGAISEIFDRASRENKNDEISEVLKKFVIKYKEELTPFLLKDFCDSLTIYCMLSLNHNSFEFGHFLRKQFQEYGLDEERVRILMYWIDPSLPVLDWMIANPDFFRFPPKHFDGMFKQLFLCPLKRKIKKEECEYFNYVVEKNLHTMTDKEFELAVHNNITLLVKKNYKKFDLYQFSDASYYDNACTRFIAKTIQTKEQREKVKEYKKLQKELPIKGDNKKRVKV
jgi:hypothetical protein